MPLDKEELTERAQLVRMFEAACTIHFPTPTDLNFRHAIEKKLGLALNLKEMRQVEISGPHTTTPASPTRRPGRTY